jgi:sodium transport system permease protein
MSARNVKIVYAKELLDLLRDRRTIISMVVVPILFMPLVILTMTLLMTKFIGQARQEISKVMILGGRDSTNTLQALQALKSIQIVPSSDDFTNSISEKHIRAAVEIPRGFDEAVGHGEKTTIHIYFYQGELKSTFADDTLERFFRQRNNEIVTNRLAAAHMPTSVLTPFAIERSNVAPPQKVNGNLVGMILPYLVIIMCMTGSIYPAVDLTAGEKERGTMETLLTSPVERTHLVLGKVLVVMTAAIVTSTLALTSNGIALLLMKAFTSESGRPSILPVSINLPSLVVVGVIMIPLAVFFAAVMVAIGLYSRSAKEANSYLQPLLILTILPALAAALPGVEMNYQLAFIPILNVSLLARELLTGTYYWQHIVIVFGAMCFYAGIAVSAAVAAFKRETVLFRT